MSLLFPQRTGSVILGTELFDNATIVAHGDEVVGFPYENLQTPQPNEPWKLDFTGAENWFFSVDFGPDPLAFNMFSLLFGRGIQESYTGDLNSQWRVRLGTTQGSGNLFDSGVIPIWPMGFADPGFGIPVENDFRGPAFYERGVAVHLILGDNVVQTTGASHPRFMRVDVEPPFETASSFGRFVAGLAVPLVVRSEGAIPMPTGSPSRFRVRWPIVTDRTIYESDLLPLVLRHTSEPRTLMTWGHDLLLPDGGRPVVAVNNILAPDPWTQHQQTVYGIVESMRDPSVAAAGRRVESELTFRGL